ncbi:MAG TPA: hypothetical protein VLZ81_15020 [Blastocatellia bacterium]|nr:hypothetical protein [Blastocatellia bacterium]
MGGLAATIKGFRWTQWLLLGCFLLATFLTAFTIYRTVGHARAFRHHRNEPIRAWMTVGYVAHTYHVPAAVLYDALGLPGDRFDKRPLKVIAREQHKSMDEIRVEMEEAIVQAGSPYMSPTPTRRGPPPRAPVHATSEPQKGATP